MLTERFSQISPPNIIGKREASNLRKLIDPIEKDASRVVLSGAHLTQACLGVRSAAHRRYKPALAISADNVLSAI